MKRASGNPLSIDHCNDYEDACDLDALLHPAQAFEHPSDVVNDLDLTLNEKRAILASWASDACAVESAPALRKPPGNEPIRFDDIMDALRELDRQAGQHYRPHYKRVFAKRRPVVFGRKAQGSDDSRGPLLN